MVICFTKKKLILSVYFYFLRPAFGYGCLGHPQSLEYYVIHFHLLYNSVFTYRHGQNYGEKQEDVDHPHSSERLWMGPDLTIYKHNVLNNRVYQL